jgi:hypothetical protein
VKHTLMIVVLILSALALAACAAGVPTPGLVVTTTAKQIEPAVASARTSQDQCDIPENRYLLVTATERQDICYQNCDCPPPTPPTGPLTQTEQQQLMQDLVHEGAKGFVHTTTAINMGACACIAGWDWLEPIDQLPFIWTFANIDHEFNVWLRCADPDGTVMAAIDGVTYSFRPGDAWQATYETGPDPSDPVQCPSGYRGRWVQVLSFRNDGLLDQSQFPPLGVPTPTLVSPSPTVPAATHTPEPPTAISPSSTPVSIAAWVAEGIPPDTLIQFHTFVDEFQPFPGVDAYGPEFIEIRADGAVRTTKWTEGSEAAAYGEGRVSQEELKALLLKFAESDFFGLQMEGPLCVHHVSRPPAAGHESGLMPGAPQIEIVTHITIGGAGKSIGYVTGFATPCDPGVLGADGWPDRSEGTLAELERAILEIGRRADADAARAEPRPAATPTPAATPIPGAPAPPGQAEALALIYGDAVNCGAEGWGVPPGCQRRWPEALTDPRFEGIFSSDLLTTELFLGVPYRQASVDRYLVFTANNERMNTGHTSAPIIDGAVLSWLDGRWELTSLTEAVLHAGVWGAAPYPAEGLRLGPEKQGAVLYVGDSNSSGAQQTAYVVAPVDGELRSVLDLEVAADNWNGCHTINEYLCLGCDLGTELINRNDPVPCWAYDSVIEAVPGVNPDYYDLKVTRRGRMPGRPPDDGDMFLVPADDIAVYRYVQGEYRKE